MRKLSVRDFTDNALIAGVYAVVTIVTSGFSYLGIQFRIAEVLVLLCFFNPTYVIGVSLGCLISNFFSPLGMPDIVFGTLATIISAVLVSRSRRLLVAPIYPVVVNALVVGAELYFVLALPFWLSALEVAAGEAAVMAVGVILFYFSSRNRAFHRAIRSRRVPK